MRTHLLLKLAYPRNHVRNNTGGWYPKIKQVMRFPLVSPHSGNGQLQGENAICSREWLTAPPLVLPATTARSNGAIETGNKWSKLIPERCVRRPSAGRTKGGGGERGPLSGHTGEGSGGRGAGSGRRVTDPQCDADLSSSITHRSKSSFYVG